MKNKTLWVSVIVFIILAVIFVFTDLQIMQEYSNPISVWGHFMQAYGQLPGMLVGFFGGSILLRLTKPEKSFKSIGSSIGFFILTMYMAFKFRADALGQQV